METPAPKHIDWLLQAGKGSMSLFIGETEEDVMSLLGQPQSVISEFEGHCYYLYPKLGLQVDFNPKTRLVRALSFHRNGVNGYKQSPAETVEGLAPGATKRKVLDILGTPDKSNSVASSARGWVWYQQGIQFDFNEDGIVDSASLAEVWLAADHFYDVLERWRKSFDDEWASLPKVAADTAG